MADRVVACHQPNFLPWLGFWAKMAGSDVFVLLDDVQFTQGAGKHNWTTRVRIDGTNGPVWLSVPVVRSGVGQQRIDELRSDANDSRWLRKMLRTIEDSYRRAPYFPSVAPPILDILSAHEGSIAETNIKLIEHVADLLRLTARLERSSSLAVPGTSNERLVGLTQQCGGSIYLAGGGANQYQVEACFSKAGISLAKVGFHHPEYPQRPGKLFEPGLSVLDALCRVGPETTRELVIG